MKKGLLLILLLAHSVFTRAQYQQFSSTRNSNGFYHSSNNCFTYNKALNVLAFTQRLTAAWPDSAFVNVPDPLGVSGYLVTKWSADNGTTWDSTCYYQNDVNRARYPNGVIYNPPGNTQVQSAYAVGFGPTYNGTSWSGMYFASAQLDGSISAKPNMHTQIANDQQWFAMDSLSIGDSINLYPASSTVTDNNVWVCASVVKGNYDPIGLAIIKGTLIDSVFLWEIDTVFRNQWVINEGGYTYLNGDPQIAFQPNNSMVGYLLVNGVDSLGTNFLSKITYVPIVWKTIDGGQHWNRVNNDYNWKETIADAFLFGNIKFPLTEEILYGSYPKFTNRFGGEITVDENGYLNYVTAVEATVSYHRDSLHYSYPNGGYEYSTQEICDQPYIIHLRTNGNGSWDKKMLNVLHSTEMGRYNNNNPWAYPSGSEASYNNRLQISRTDEGSKIFFSWIDTELADVSGSATQNPPNNKPSFSYMGYDVASNLYTVKKNISKNNTNANGFWWMYVSDIVMNNGTDYMLPMVYASQNTGGNFSTTAKNDLYFVNDAVLNDSDFISADAGEQIMLENQCVIICFPIGINQAYGYSSIKAFPNPVVDNLTIKLKDNDATQLVKVNIYNSAGILVKVENSEKVYGSIFLKTEELPQGLYIVEMETSNGTERVKIIKE